MDSVKKAVTETDIMVLKEWPMKTILRLIKRKKTNATVIQNSVRF
jgi:hypothetical protein